jgi:N-acetylmuramoyl-L-alanine amidase
MHRSRPHLFWTRLGKTFAYVVLMLVLSSGMVIAAKSALHGKVIALDAGHGGQDHGAIGASGSAEKHNTLATVLILKELLEGEGAKVVLTRNADYLPGYKAPSDLERLTELIRARTDLVNATEAHVLVSIHNDSNPNPELTGTSTYYWRSPLLAKTVQSHLVESLGTRDIGAIQHGFRILTRSKMPAVLVEIGFLSNAAEEKLLKSYWYQVKAAQGIINGLRAYFANR